MGLEIIDRGQWLFQEKSLPGNHIYRLLEGKVGIYHGGTKITEITVKSGDRPLLIGLISALRPDGLHTASVKSESPLRAEIVKTEQIRGIIGNEMPEGLRAEIAAMIDNILLRNEIEALKFKLKSMPSTQLDMRDVPDDLTGEFKEVLENIFSLYKNPERD